MICVEERWDKRSGSGNSFAMMVLSGFFEMGVASGGVRSRC